MNVLLVMAPLGILSHYLHWGPVAVFLLNFAALVPLALLLGEVTEDLAVRFGSTIGGLLNATFGNVVELILSIAALTKGLYVVIAASLIGSILSNLLLVLGEVLAPSSLLLLQLVSARRRCPLLLHLLGSARSCGIMQHNSTCGCASCNQHFFVWVCATGAFVG